MDDQWRPFSERALADWDVRWTEERRQSRASPSWNVNSTPGYQALLERAPRVADEVCRGIEAALLQNIEKCNDLNALQNPSQVTKEIFAPLKERTRDSLSAVALEWRNRGGSNPEFLMPLAETLQNVIASRIDLVAANVATRMTYRAKDCERTDNEDRRATQRHYFDMAIKGMTALSAIWAVAAPYLPALWVTALGLAVLAYGRVTSKRDI